MAIKHPKDRRIPKALLKTRMFKNSNLEDKVILWVHVLELIVIITLLAVTTATALYMSISDKTDNTSHNSRTVTTREY